MHDPVGLGVNVPLSGTVKNNRSPTAYVVLSFEGSRTAVNVRVDTVLIPSGVAAASTDKNSSAGQGSTHLKSSEQ